jgi:hypothetical protein
MTQRIASAVVVDEIPLTGCDAGVAGLRQRLAAILNRHLTCRAGADSAARGDPEARRVLGAG